MHTCINTIGIFKQYLADYTKWRNFLYAVIFTANKNIPSGVIVSVSKGVLKESSILKKRQHKKNNEE